MMESLKMMFILLACISGCLQLAAGVATSHQSIVSGEGWGYGYGIVHGPHGHGHVTGHSYPHGYGGFGSYAPSYDYNGYGVGHEDLHHVIPVPAIHAPLPVHAEHPPVHAEHLPLLPALPVHEPSLTHYPAKPQVVTPIQAIHPLPHVVPATKPYALPSYASSYHDYGSLLGDHYGDYLSGSLGYGGKYGDLSYGGKYVIGYGGKYGDLSYGGKYGDLSYGGKYGDLSYGGKYGDLSHGGKYGDLIYGGKYGDLFQGGKYGSLSYGNLLSHYYDDDHLLHDYHSYDDLLSDHGHKVVYSGTVGDHYKPYYHDYYGPTSYQH